MKLVQKLNIQFLAIYHYLLIYTDSDLGRSQNLVKLSVTGLSMPKTCPLDIHMVHVYDIIGRRCLLFVNNQVTSLYTDPIPV